MTKLQALYLQVISALLVVVSQVSCQCPSDLSFDFLFIPWNVEPGSPVSPPNPPFPPRISSYTVEPNGITQPTLLPVLGFPGTEGGPGQQRKYVGGPFTAIPLSIEDGVGTFPDDLPDDFFFFFTETCTRLDDSQEFWQCDGSFNNLQQFNCSGTIAYQGFIQEVKGPDITEPTLNGEFAIIGGSFDKVGVQGSMTESLETITIDGVEEPWRIRNFQSFVE